MSPDIKEATDLLKTEKIWNAVKNYMEQYHAKQVSNLKYSKEAQLTIHNHIIINHSYQLL